ncbi:hypothetical protein GCM10010399_26000 [Dactylosporangium fulvum]
MLIALSGYASRVSTAIMQIANAIPHSKRGGVGRTNRDSEPARMLASLVRFRT